MPMPDFAMNMHRFPLFLNRHSSISCEDRLRVNRASGRNKYARPSIAADWKSGGGKANDLGSLLQKDCSLGDPVSTAVAWGREFVAFFTDYQFRLRLRRFLILSPVHVASEDWNTSESPPYLNLYRCIYLAYAWVYEGVFIYSALVNKLLPCTFEWCFIGLEITITIMISTHITVRPFSHHPCIHWLIHPSPHIRPSIYPAASIDTGRSLPKKWYETTV